MAYGCPTYHIDYLYQPNGLMTLPATAKRYSGGGLGFKNYEAACAMADFWRDNADELGIYNVTVVTSYTNTVPFDTSK